MQLKAIVAGLLLAKQTYGRLRQLSGAKTDFHRGLDEARSGPLTTRGTTFQETSGGNYLSRQEVEEFSRTGMLKPFRVLTAPQAAQVRQRAETLHACDFDNKLVVGNEVAEVMKRHSQWGINYSGLFQALYHPEFWDVLSAPAITQRLASLLGDDVLCWRSQFFQKKPGSAGTFWHQTGTFRESSNKPKLIAPEGVDAGSVQYTCWVALSDCTIENGCMRFMPGSFMDGRFERLAYSILDSKVDYVMQLSQERIEQLVWALRCTSGNFVRAQLAFELVLDELPDLFSEGHVFDLELKAGEAVIFTSMNMHASYPNVTPDDTRLAIAGRYTSNDVQVYPEFKTDAFPTPEGEVQFSLDRIGCMQVHGEDRLGQNRIVERPQGDGLNLSTPTLPPFSMPAAMPERTV